MPADVDAVALELDGLGDPPQVPAGLQHDDPAPGTAQQLQGRGQPRRASADDDNRFISKSKVKTTGFQPVSFQL